MGKTHEVDAGSASGLAARFDVLWLSPDPDPDPVLKFCDKKIFLWRRGGRGGRGEKSDVAPLASWRD